MKTGIELIAAERARQIKAEGWTTAHDDAHNQRELARAAQTYVDHYVGRAGLIERGVISLREYQRETLMGWAGTWPCWLKRWWKPKDPITTLVKAGALIAAEIDRLNRAKADERFRFDGCKDQRPGGL